MYILITTIIVLISYLFGSTIFKIFTSYSSNDLQTGNIWFVSLLIINITVIIFLYLYTNYIPNQIGLKGNPGYAGYKGKDGNDCIITDPKSIYYEEYTKIPMNTLHRIVTSITHI
jgi:hypothetical protein